MTVGLAAGSAPTARTQLYDRTLALIRAAADTKVTEKNLVRLRAATAEHAKAEAAALGVSNLAVDRLDAAQAAEAKATKARQALADETAKAQAALGERGSAVAKREADADGRDEKQDVRAADLKRREGLLKQAGQAAVSGL